MFELPRKRSSDILCWASPTQDGSTATPVDTAHPGIGDLGSVIKITPWESCFNPFPTKKSVVAKRREGELLEVLMSVSQLSPGPDAFAEALGLVPGERLHHTGAG